MAIRTPVFNQAIRTVEGIYHTSYQEHAYLEPQGGDRPRPRPDGGRRCARLDAVPLLRASRPGPSVWACRPEQVVVRQSPTGGAFGGKEDYPSVLALHAALLALRCNGPGADDSRSARRTWPSPPKRHPSRTRIRTALDAEGHLLAMDVDLLMGRPGALHDR